MPNILKLTLVLAVIAAMAGCASVGEKRAMEDWDRVNEESQRLLEESTVFPELAENASLDDYVLYGMLLNPGLEAAFDRWKAALERIEPARTLPDPRFTYGYFIRSVETRVGPQEQKFGLSQVFPWFGKLGLRAEVALEAAHAQHQRYEAEKLALVYRIKKVYFEYWYLDRSIVVTRENIKLLTYLEEVARMKYKTGVGGHSAILKAQVELGRLEDRLGALRDLRRPMAAKLNAALNRPLDAHVSIPDSLPEPPAQYDEEALFAALHADNPNLRVLDHAAAAEGKRIDLAQKNFFPDVMFGVDYIQTDDARAGMMPAPDDSGRDPVVAMVSLNLPIWHGKYHAIRREAEARRRAALESREEKENRLAASLETALFHARDAERKIDLYRDTLIPKAEQALGVAQTAFTGGKAQFLDLIDAQRALLEFQLAHQRALTDRADKMAEIDMLTAGALESAPGETQ